MPIGYARLFANPRLNWMYESEPEPELHGRTMYQPRGKVLGGTSSINGMVYMRGNPADYDLVAPARLHRLGLGQRSAVFQEGRRPGARRRAKPTAVGGPLRVSDQPVRWELAEHFIAAAIEAGLPANNDFNDGEQDGAGPFQNTTERRAALEHGGRLSARRRSSRANLAIRDRGAGDAHSRRRRPRERCRVRLRRRPPRRAGAGRDHRLRRRLQLAAAAATVRAWAGGDCCRSTASRWCATCPRSAPICRTISMSAWRFAAPSRSPSTMSPTTRCTESGRTAILCCSRRGRWPATASAPAASRAATRVSTAPTSSSISASGALPSAATAGVAAASLPRL